MEDLHMNHSYLRVSVQRVERDPVDKSVWDSDSSVSQE